MAASANDYAPPAQVRVLLQHLSIPSYIQSVGTAQIHDRLAWCSVTCWAYLIGDVNLTSRAHLHSSPEALMLRG